MAAPNKESASSLPIPSYQYQVKIGDEMMAFSEVSGLSIGRKYSYYKDGLSFKFGSERYMSGVTATPVKLQRGVFRDGNVATFCNWMYGLIEERLRTVPVEISLVDEKGEPVLTWRSEKCLPTNLELGTLRAAGDEVAVQSLELSAPGLKVVHPERKAAKDLGKAPPSAKIHLGKRFAVAFIDPLAAGLAAGVGALKQKGGLDLGGALADLRFQSVSGLSTEITMDTVREGGQNLYSHRLPTGTKPGNLVLKRGLASASAIDLAQFHAAMSFFTFSPTVVLVTLLGQSEAYPEQLQIDALKGNAPVAAWAFYGAYPVKWATDDLDATKRAVVIDTMELAYRWMKRISL